MKGLVIVSAFLLWLAVMLAEFVVAGKGFAQNLPPTQTINTNDGVLCNGTGGTGPVARCHPSWTYGCSADPISKQILDTDGNRTAIQIQNTGLVPLVLCFGDQCAGNNGFVVQPCNSYIWSNVGTGNTPGRIATTRVSIISAQPTTCTFMFSN